MYHRQTSGSITFVPTPFETYLATLSDADKQAAIDSVPFIDMDPINQAYVDGSNGLAQSFAIYNPANQKRQAILADIPDFDMNIVGFTPDDLSFLK